MLNDDWQYFSKYYLKWVDAKPTDNKAKLLKCGYQIRQKLIGEKEMIRQYQLTDGQDVFDGVDWFTTDEAKEANRKAKESTDGNIWWEEVKWSDGDADYLLAEYSNKN